MFSQAEINRKREVYKALKKLSNGKGEWDLRWGDFCLYGKEIMIVIELSPDIKLSTQNPRMRTFVPVNPEKLIPLLHWERTVEVMWTLGYTKVLFLEYPQNRVGAYFRKGEFVPPYLYGMGKNWGEAVEDAVLIIASDREIVEKDK